MDKASAYGAGDCRFESYQDHFYRLAPWFRLHVPAAALQQLPGVSPNQQGCDDDDVDDDDDVGFGAAFLHGDHAV